ncbi:MAG: InlB B-repeat-containing protein, partial [Clostridiales bacterium]|nr:InlB B-repeat-containing protein [Clostridiales bacterium]
GKYGYANKIWVAAGTYHGNPNGAPVVLIASDIFDRAKNEFGFRLMANSLLTIAAGVSPLADPAETDKSGLWTAILGAEANLGSVAVSTNGAGVAADKFWVSSSVKDAYEKAIKQARDFILGNALSTNAGIVQATNELAAATSDFNYAKKAGTDAYIPSNDATLGTLTVNPGTLVPVFSAGTTSYTVSVANNVASITINATVNHEKAIVGGAGAKNLSVGTNNFTITVTAENDTKKKYTVTVTRAGSTPPPTTFTIKYDENGGDGKMSSGTVDSGADYKIATNMFKRTSYTFSGWNTAANGSGTSYQENATIENVQSNITLYAQWSSSSTPPGGGGGGGSAKIEEPEVPLEPPLLENKLSDIEGTLGQAEIEFCQFLGIVTGNPDGTYLPGKDVNRAEFAAIITRTMGVPESTLTEFSTSSFKDTSGYGWAVPYLAYCQSKGIMIGDGNGNAMPGRTIKVSEAMTMICRALGYVDNSELLTGSWPENYIALAQKLWLYDKIDADAKLMTKEMSAIAIYNSLTAQKVSVASDGKTELQWLAGQDGVIACFLNTGLGRELTILP